MGECSPPTVADYANAAASDALTEARNAKAIAQGMVMQVQSLERRVTYLEDTLIEALRLIDSNVSELSTRIIALEQR